MWLDVLRTCIAHVHQIEGCQSAKASIAILLRLDAWFVQRWSPELCDLLGFRGSDKQWHVECMGLDNFHGYLALWHWPGALKQGSILELFTAEKSRATEKQGIGNAVCRRYSLCQSLCNIPGEHAVHSLVFEMQNVFYLAGCMSWIFWWMQR